MVACVAVFALVGGLVSASGLTPPAPDVPTASDANSESAAPETPMELRYSVDMDLLKQEFRETGTVTLAVPLLGEIIVAGEGHDLTSHGNRSLNLGTIAVLGSVQGHINSTANLYLGEYGVYGLVEVQGSGSPIKFEFDAVETIAGVYEAWVHIDDALETETLNLTAGQGRDGQPIVYAEIPSWTNVLPPVTSAMTSPTASGGEKFESGATDWTFSGLWRVTTRKSVSTTHSAWYGDPASGTGNYATGTNANSGNLDSPSFTVPSSGPILQFQSWYQTEDTGANWDRKLVQISTNGGASWTTIDQVFNTPMSTWTVKSVDLASYAGQSAKLRFRFDTMDGLYNTYEGWYVDDIAVFETYVSPPPPPPSNNGCTSPPKSNAAISVGTTSPNTWYQGKSTADEANSPPDPCSGQPDCSGGYGVSWVTYHADYMFANTNANWRDRIVSAAALYAPMWQSICITLRVWPVETGEYILTSGSCDGSNDVVEQYSNWLKNTWFNSAAAWNDDAYQLWTGHNLESNDGWPPEAYCFGLANSDKVDISRVGFTELAASVVEGTDYCCADYYDPDEVGERGIVSGHEMAHVYGEENHPYKCNKNEWYSTASDCNMMRNCKDPGKRSFYFTLGSKQEIMFRYHYRQETTSGYEGKAACP